MQNKGRAQTQAQKLIALGELDVPFGVIEATVGPLWLGTGRLPYVHTSMYIAALTMLHMSRRCTVHGMSTSLHLCMATAQRLLRVALSLLLLMPNLLLLLLAALDSLAAQLIVAA